MTRQFQIESNIPTPPPSTRRGKWMTLAREMKDGDSVVLNNYQESNSLYTALKRLGYKVRTAKENGGVRLWKLEANHDQTGAGL